MPACYPIHTPDLALEGFDGSGTFTLVEVKTIDPAGPTHIHAQHITDRDRGAAHVHAMQYIPLVV